MIVVDASVMVDALVDDGPAGHRAWLLLSEDTVWFSSAHLESEVMSAIRGRLLGGKLGLERAADAVTQLAHVRLSRVEPTTLLRRMWELRDNLTAYDAAYVATAETLRCALVTADARVAAAPGIRCEVRLAA